MRVQFLPQHQPEHLPQQPCHPLLTVLKKHLSYKFDLKVLQVHPFLVAHILCVLGVEVAAEDVEAGLQQALLLLLLPLTLP